MTSTGPSAARDLEPETITALQRALAAEHAADWVYHLATAFLRDSYDAALREGIATHRARRDVAERILRDAGAVPVVAEPSYSTPNPVTDQASAMALLITAEDDAAAAWRAVLERATDTQLRQASSAGLTAAAVRSTRWRKAAGKTPLSVPFPGQS